AARAADAHDESDGLREDTAPRRRIPTARCRHVRRGDYALPWNAGGIARRLRESLSRGANHGSAIPAGTAGRCDDAPRTAGDAAPARWITGRIRELHLREDQSANPYGTPGRAGSAR